MLSSTKKNVLLISLMLFISVFFVISVFALAANNGDSQTQNPSNVYMENGVQVIELSAKNGYKPRVSVAQAGLESVLRVSTNGTFDCSAVVSLPEIGVRRGLAAYETVDIELGTREKSVFHGSCGMGMNPFEIHFQ
jgi:plastocyanin domain-containing protein